MQISLNIKPLAEKRGFSLRQLHKKSGLSYQGLWAIANGKTRRIDLKTLEVICEALECEPVELFLVKK